MGAVDRGVDAADSLVLPWDFPTDLLPCPTDRRDFLLESQKI